MSFAIYLRTTHAGVALEKYCNRFYRCVGKRGRISPPLRRKIVYYNNFIESNLSSVGIIFIGSQETHFHGELYDEEGCAYRPLTSLIFQIGENTDRELVRQNAHITYDNLLSSEMKSASFRRGQPFSQVSLPCHTVQRHWPLWCQ